MNRNILTGVAALTLAAAMLTGCKEEVTPGGAGNGRIALDIDLDASPLTGKNPAVSRAAGEIKAPVTADELKLTLKASDDRDFTKTWESLAQFDATELIPVGTYTLEATYGDATSEGWGKPYYYGVADLRVRNEQTTDVSMTVALANSIIALKYTDTFKDYMQKYSATVHSEGGGYFEYDETSADELYILPGVATIDVTVTKPDGTEGTVEAARFTAMPRYRHTVTIDVNNGEVGKEFLTLTFDDTLDNEEFTIDISDDIFSASAPELTPVGFNAGDELAFVETVGITPGPKANIVARGKIGSVTLTTSSAALLAAGWPAEVDLAAPSAADKAKLQELGLNTLGVWNSPDVMGVVDFSGVLPKISYVEGDDNVSTFTLAVTDRAKKTCEPLSFSVKVEKLDLTLVSGAIETAGEMTVQVRYNGGDLRDNVKFFARNGSGAGTSDAVADPLTIASATPSASNPSLWDVVLKGSFITLDKSVNIFARSGDIKTADLLVKVPAMRIVEEANNAFATHADLTVNYYDADVAANSGDARIYISTDGGSSFTAASATAKAPRRSRAAEKTVVYTITGLTPTTAYTAYVQIGDDRTAMTTFTTEAAAQLPNAGMEDWYQEDVYTNTQWSLGTTGMTDIKRWFPNANGESYWATRNPMTTGQTSGTTCYYTSYSGTIAVNGTSGKAAEISTLGFGEGTTYAHTSSGKNGSPKKKIAGMLFTGDYAVNGDNEEITLGKPFTSRPSSISFNYKFAPVNSESFQAYIVIENRDNGTVTELGRGEFTSSESISSFTNKTIDITYSNTILKATHITVVFESSTAGSNVKVLSVQGSKNALNGYSDSKYVGSVLTIDDIVLNY